MRTIKTCLSCHLVWYLVILGIVLFLLCSNDYLLEIIERAVEIRMNPINIEDWLRILIGS